MLARPLRAGWRCYRDHDVDGRRAAVLIAFGLALLIAGAAFGHDLEDALNGNWILILMALSASYSWLSAAWTLPRRRWPLIVVGLPLLYVAGSFLLYLFILGLDAIVAGG